MTISQTGSQEVKIILGNFNAKLGKAMMDNVLGVYCLGVRNERSEKLIEWTQINDMLFGNAWFKQHERRLYTWKIPTNIKLNQIRYIVIYNKILKCLAKCENKDWR